MCLPRGIYQSSVSILPEKLTEVLSFLVITFQRSGIQVLEKDTSVMQMQEIHIHFFFFATKCSMWDLSFPTRHQTAPTAMEGQSQPWTAREVLTSFLLNNDFRKGGQEPIFRVSAGTKNEFF